MLYNRCTDIYTFGNNTYPRHIRHRSNLGHIFQGKKCVLWVRKYSSLLTRACSCTVTYYFPYLCLGLQNGGFATNSVCTSYESHMSHPYNPSTFNQTHYFVESITYEAPYQVIFSNLLLLLAP